MSRFIQEMNIKRRGDDDETPDEGDVDAASDENLADVNEESEMSEEDRHKRVRLMTIHGAKGLESPFVIILDANNFLGFPQVSHGLFRERVHLRKMKKCLFAFAPPAHRFRDCMKVRAPSHD